MKRRIVHLIWIAAAISMCACSSEGTERFLIDMVHHNPGEAKTQSSFLDAKKLAQRGYNGQASPNFIESTVVFDSLDREIFPEGSEGRAWVVEHANEIEKQIQAAHDAGVAFYAFTDFIVLPKLLVEKYKGEILTKDRIDLHRPVTEKILRAQIGEIFARYPDLDGLIVRWGETYLVDVPFHTGGNPMVRGAESQVALINLLREEVCEKRGKMLFYRTWGSHFHTEPEYYLKVTNRIEPHPKLVFSIKYPKGDFHRMELFNPTIGIGKHRQIIEIQCQPEAYGKCAHPYFIGSGVIDGWEELGYLQDERARRCFYDRTGGGGKVPGVSDHEIAQMHVKNLTEFARDERFAGVWTWSRGGGWQGPYIKNEFWCELNAWVVSQWLVQGRTTAELVREFARERLGLKGVDIERFARLCDLSAAAVLRGHMSMQEYTQGWWTRDHWIGGTEQVKETLELIFTNGTKEKFLAEKAEASAMWKQIESIARQLRITDAELQEFVITSCTYGRILHEIFETGWTVMILGYEGDKTGQYETEHIAAAIAKYDILWQQWRDMEQKSPSCATIYKDFYPRYEKGIGMFPTEDGLGASVNRYRKILEEK